MYKYRKPNNTKVTGKEKLEGEPIETKIRRIMENKEPIKDGAPLIYTERKDGVIAGYNIRTDRFEIACEAMDNVHKANIAKRDNKPPATMEVVKDDGEARTAQGTE